MAKKLTTIERTFVPDMTFPDDESKTGFVKNRDLPEGEKVVCQIRAARMGEQAEYIGSYTVGTKVDTAKQFTSVQYERCVKKHVESITGLEEWGITNGVELCTHDATPELNDIIKECFFKINGLHEDDSVEKSDGGNLSSGE